MKAMKTRLVESTIRLSDIYLMLIMFFSCTFIYFRWIADYLLFYQEQQFLFTYTGEYIREFFLKPGGILELSGKFLTQFYADKTLGSILLSGVLTLLVYLFFCIKRKKTESTSFIPLLLLPSSLLLLMQSDYDHLMELNLGFVFVLIVLLIQDTFLNRKHYFILIIYPLIYYILGSFAWLFLVIHVFTLLISGEKSRFVNASLIIAEGAIIPLFFKKFIFLGSYSDLYFSPVPFIDDHFHNILMIVCAIYFLIFTLFRAKSAKIKSSIFINRSFNLISMVMTLLVTFSFLLKHNDSRTGKVIHIEELIYKGKYNEAIDYQEKEASANLLSQYFYNIALTETDQLCDRLFFGRQDFGTGSLLLPWGDKHLSWGAYFFYGAGLANEAERRAYEEMVAYGKNPQNMIMLIKTNLVNGNYRMADKYIGVLKNTFYYSKEANDFGKLISDTALLLSDADLGGKKKIQPGFDFFIYVDSAENNLPMLINNSINNKKAFEYLMSWLMLNKNVEAVINNASLMKKLGYTRIPRHIEEAILMYNNSTGKYPDLEGLTITRDSQERFQSYFNAYVKARNNPSSLKERMKIGFGNTYWYYYHFS